VLHDANGPVLVTVENGRPPIHFRAKGNVRIEQGLTLRHSVRVARNHLVVRKFGIHIATWDETISTIDGPGVALPRLAQPIDSVNFYRSPASSSP
jgi:hypothetical protein